MFLDTEQKIKQAAINSTLLTKDQILVINEEQRKYNLSFTEACTKLDFINTKNLNKLIEQITGITYLDLDNIYIDFELLKKFELKFLEECKVLVISKNNSYVEVTISDPEEIIIKDSIKQKIKSVFNDDKINVNFSFSDLNKINEILDEVKKTKITANKPLAEMENSLTDKNDVINSLNYILEMAIRENASDIHFQPENYFINIKYRVDGLLQLAHTIHKSIWPNFAVRIKIMSNLDISESRKPQSGHCEFNLNNKKCDLRISTHPTIYGENIVIRILYKNKQLPTLEDLGFEKENANKLLEIIDQPNGIILICGATGSGKTTTLYTLCSHMESINKNIMTLEEPVEYQLKNVRQTEIKEDGLINFADGVRSILRQDPDIIFIGEIRDEETAKMAIRSSMTGHLVLSTLHTNNSFSVPNRLFDLGINPAFLSGQLLAIISQRLVRKTCKKCEAQKHATQKCSHCNFTGFKGRIAINEIIKISTAIDDCISQQKPLSCFIECAKKEGFKSIVEDAISKIEHGLTTKEEVIRVLGQNI